MLDVPFLSTPSQTEAPAISPAALAAAFFADHGDALAHAAELLGGRRWFGRWCRVSGDLQRGCLSAGQVRREIRAFLGLLRLEDVGDPNREETARFAMLHPDSAEVHELCLLADALARLLDEVDQAATLSRHASPAPGAILVQRGDAGRDAVGSLPATRWRSRPAAKARARRESPACVPRTEGR